MRSPTVAEVLRALAQNRDELLTDRGEVHHTRLANALGFRQATVSRIFNGTIKEPSQSFVDAAAAYFDVLPAQIRGEMEIPLLFPKDRYSYIMNTDRSDLQRLESALDALPNREIIQRLLHRLPTLNQADANMVVRGILQHLADQSRPQ